MPPRRCFSRAVAKADRSLQARVPAGPMRPDPAAKGVPSRGLWKDRDMRIQPAVLRFRMAFAEQRLHTLDVVLRHIDHAKDAALIDEIVELPESRIRNRRSDHARHPHSK